MFEAKSPCGSLLTASLISKPAIRSKRFLYLKPTLLLCVLLQWPLAHGQTIVFNDFSDLSTFTLNGDSASIGNPIFFNGVNVLRLTDGLSESSSAFLTTPISLSADASFSTVFSFQFTDPQGIGSPPGADGIVFAVQTESNTAGGGGAGIGFSGISNSVGIEFDTFFNGVTDPDGNHIGLNVSGNIVSLVTTSITEPFNNGAIWFAWIDYDGTTDQIEVRISQTSSRPAGAALTAVVDIPAELATSDAFVGFTSATGAGANDHDLRSWQFEPTFTPFTTPTTSATSAPAEPVPIPLSFVAALALAILLLGAVRRRTAARR
ncbi:MAG: L-type lectin-domain containing protein [Pseudomonadota bacterium]